MDENSVRLKKYLDKVFYLYMENYKNCGFGNVIFYFFYGGLNQRWKFEGDNIIFDY